MYIFVSRTTQQYNSTAVFHHVKIDSNSTLFGTTTREIRQVGSWVGGRLGEGDQALTVDSVCGYGLGSWVFRYGEGASRLGINSTDTAVLVKPQAGLTSIPFDRTLMVEASSRMANPISGLYFASRTKTVSPP